MQRLEPMRLRSETISLCQVRELVRGVPTLCFGKILLHLLRILRTEEVLPCADAYPSCTGVEKVAIEIEESLWSNRIRLRINVDVVMVDRKERQSTHHEQ